MTSKKIRLKAILEAEEVTGRMLMKQEIRKAREKDGSCQTYAGD